MTFRRRVLGTFVVAWLAVLLQPCVMALGLDQDCAHCPPAETPCELATSQDCAFGDQLNAESRSQQLKDSPSEVPVAIAPACHEPAKQLLKTQARVDSSVLINPSGPSRNVLFCVYLK